MDTKSDGEDGGSRFHDRSGSGGLVTGRPLDDLCMGEQWTHPLCSNSMASCDSRRHQLTEWMQQHTTCPSASSDQVSEPISGARSRQHDSSHHGGRGSSCEEAPDPV